MGEDSAVDVRIGLSPRDDLTPESPRDDVGRDGRLFKYPEWDEVSVCLSCVSNPKPKDPAARPEKVFSSVSCLAAVNGNLMPPILHA